MRFVIIAILVGVALATPTFDQYKAKHNLIFSAEEEAVRRAIYHSNLNKIEALNNMKDGATYGVTEFAHLSEDEFRATKTGLRGTDSHGCPTTTRVSANGAPDAFDWREKGAVTPVKNQGSCGSCWAFSTTGDIEGTHFIKTGQLVSISEQDLVDCDKVDQGCNGGLPTQAFESVIEAGGIESEADYAYEGRDDSCKFSKSKVAVTISNYTCVSTDEAEIAAFVAQNGPVSIGLNAGTLQFYMGGVANPWDILCSPKHIDHGVLIVGYGTEGDKPYWIVKNSWGTSWGEKGYFRMIRGKGKCGMNLMVSHSIA